MAGAAGALAAGVKVANAAADAAGGLKGNIHHSVCKWCYKDMSLEDLCRNAAAMGIASVELLGPDDWPTVKKHGLTCAMPMGPSGIGDGWNRPADHDKLVTESERLLPLIKEAGLPNMIVFSGNRHGLADEEGMDNCAQGLKRIMALAERLQITVCMELLNSKVDHHDYQCDHTDWGVELCKKIGSERFKLLYDIYHMQIMEGDVVRTIRDNIEYIAHFHTGGVPGRHEIDETQELSYAFVAKAIVEAGFKGFMAQEFIPARDPMTSLNEAIHICDV
jgi:hydroxypyruvate isomerase